MLKKGTAFFLCAVLLLCTFAGCSRNTDITSGAASQEYPVTVGEVTLKGEPQGVAVLSPNLADVILALGYEITLKAKSAECTQAELAVLPAVQPNDAQAMKDAGADTVLVDSLPPEEQLKSYQEAGLQVIAIAPATGRDDFNRLYTETGAVLKGGKTGYERGDKIAKSICSTIDDVARMLPETDTPVAVCYLMNTEGGAATGDTMMGELIEDAGLINAVADGKENHVEIGTLLMVQPQYIFCPVGLKEKLAATEGYKDLAAVQEGRVVEMDPNLMELQGRGMVKAVSLMAGTVFPELTEGTPPTPASSTPSGATDTENIGSDAPASSAPSSSSSSQAASSSQASAASGKALQRGAQGDDVLKMQKRLEELGYLFVKPSGLFAEGTEQCVKDFQYLNGLEVTGIADEKTLALLYSDSAKPRKD